MATSSSLTEEKYICDLCGAETDTLLSKCVDCDMYMCITCSKAHTKLTSGHTVISDQELPVRSKSKCSTHIEEDVKYFCETCDQLICPDCCILGNHKSHSFNKIKDVAKRKQQTLSQALDEFTNSHIPALRAALENVELLQNENTNHGKKTDQQIKDKADELIAVLQKASNKISLENETCVNQNSKYLERTHSVFSNDLSDVETICENLQTVLNKGSDIEKITAEKETAGLLRKLQARDLEVNIQLQTFVPGTVDAAIFHRAIGSIDTGEDQGSDFDSSNGKQTDVIRTNADPNIVIDVNIVSAFNYKSKGVRSICPMSVDLALIHGDDEYNNGVVSTDGHIHKNLKLDFLAYDFSLASQNSLILASDFMGKKIHKLAMDGVKINDISTAPLHPFCSCLSKDGNILVTMVDKNIYEIHKNSRRLVSRISTDGKTVQIYEYYNESRLFTIPWSIDENINGDICVVNETGSTRGHIVFLEQNGKLKTTYRGGANDDNFYPARIKCDKIGNIIVSDWNMKIHLLNSDCQLVRYLMTEKELSQNILSIAIDNTGLLWVGCWEGKVYVVKYLQ